MTKKQREARRSAATGYCHLSLIKIAGAFYFLNNDMPNLAIVCCIFSWLFINFAFSLDIPKEN
jgi:hypothetical protein